MKEIDLTKGPIAGNLWRFALPLMAGNLLQQCYNLTDTWVVGQYIGENALAAVGSAYSLMTFLTSLLFGMCLGCSAFFSMARGRSDTGLLHRGVWISFVFTGTVALFFTLLASLLVEPIMGLLNIQPQAWDDSLIYLRWIFLGLPAAYLYNYASNLLRGIGNSAAPLFFLVMSAVLNIVLDLLFVIVLKAGVRGAAAATVLSQYIAGFGITAFVFIRCRDLLPEKRDRTWDSKTAGQIASLSVFTCLQQSVMNFGILMIQGLVNSFGVSAMAAFAVAVKIDTLAYMPVQDFGNAFSTFVAQNHGAGSGTRIKKGIRAGIISVAAFSLTVSAVVYALAPSLMGLFVRADQLQVIGIGTTYLRIEGAFYLGIGILFMLYGYYRAIDLPWMSLILTVISLGTRVGLSYAFSPRLGLEVIWWSVPIGWLLADAAGILFGFHTFRKG